MFSRLFFCLLLAWVGKPALAQKSEKTLDAYGYRFEVPAKWEVDWDIEPNSVYVTENLPSISDAAMFLQFFYDSTMVKNDKDLLKKVFRAIMHNVGNAYEYPAKSIWEHTKRKKITRNSIVFQEYTTILPADENGNTTWFRLWAACDSTAMNHVLFCAATYKEPKKPEIDREKELTAIFQTIRRSDKLIMTDKPKQDIAKNKQKKDDKPAPAPKKNEPPAPVQMVKFEERILKQGESIDFTFTFVADGTDFEGDTKQELKRIIDFLKENPQIDVTIVGYASKINAGNREILGKARAEKVRDALLSAKIDKKRLQCKGSDEGGIDKRVKVVIERIR